MRILAIDPGSSLGWASNATGRLEWGTGDYTLNRGSNDAVRWHRFRVWLASVHASAGPEGLYVVYEQQNNFGRGNPASLDVSKALVAILLEYCEANGLPCESVNTQTIKAFALPKVKRPKRLKGETVEAYRVRCPLMDRGKTAMIAAATRRLIDAGLADAKRVIGGAGEVSEMTLLTPLSEHEADALWLYWWAEENCK